MVRPKRPETGMTLRLHRPLVAFLLLAAIAVPAHAQGFHALVAPTSPTVAFRFGARMADPVAMYLSDACTLPVNVAGLPGISIPCGLSEGLPVGLQFIGAPWSEAELFALARGYEGVTADADWRALEPAELAAASDPATPAPLERLAAGAA